MKREYEIPSMEIEKIELEDVIARSGPGRPAASAAEEDELIEWE